MVSTSKASFRDTYKRVRACVAKYHDTGVDGLYVAQMYHDRSNDLLVMPAIGCYKARLQEDPLIKRFWSRADLFNLGISREPSLRVVS